MGSRKKQPRKDLKSGRPPTAKPTRSMSRKASRNLINSHHQLEKRRRQAADRGETEAEAAISADLAALGGLYQYQQASLQAQSPERGGDTSRILLDWLPEHMVWTTGRRLRMLEVGALSTRNACSASGLFDMVHIDLSSREPGILQQNFMERPLPDTEAGKFDMISLSLVLNFVPDPAGRGQMLSRTLLFLRTEAMSSADSANFPFPSLFLVLPRSCVANSRYFTEKRFEELMGLLGYELAKTKTSQKLFYSLWGRARVRSSTPVEFTKQEVNPGRARNNFCITLKGSASDIA